jgi:hypothetical protein
MATKIAACAQAFSHDNFTATGTASARTLPARTNFLLVDNLDTAISILVSLDGGTTFKTVKAGASLSLDCDGLRSLYIKSASGSVSTECVYGYEA